MTKLIVITHPAVIIDPLIPIDEWSLSEKGWKQVRQAFKLEFWTSVDVLYSSYELKAYSMAEKASKKFSIPFDSAHKIYDLGETRGRTFIPPDQFDQAVKEWYSDLDHNVNGWEPINTMSKRVSTCIDSLMRKHKNRTVAVIAHGGSGTMIKCHVQGIVPSQNEDPHKVAGGYFVADWEEKKIIRDWTRYWK